MRNKISFCFVLISALLTINLFAEEMTAGQAKVARENFVAEAKKYVGCPYEFGSTGPDTFDCSGLIFTTARNATGVQLPRTAKAIYNYCRRVPDKDKEVGDLLFFKTTASESISHVGIYIGNNQFISAISDGPNTGVIISSLKQDYWKGKYISAGQFISSGNMKEFEPAMEEEVVVMEKPQPAASTTSNVKKQKEQEKKPASSKSRSKATSAGNSFLGGLVFDFATYVDWSLISPKQFMFRFRGIDVQTNARYTGWLLEPGIGFDLRFNTALDMFQVPILFSATANEYVKVYAGPVLSFGQNGVLIGNDKEISPSFFPGIIGASFTTPSWDIGGVKLQLVQDVSYTVFNNTDNSALNFVESLSAGFVMYTGVKVSLPMSIFF